MKVEGEKSVLVAHFSTTVSNLKLKTAVNAEALIQHMSDTSTQ